MNRQNEQLIEELKKYTGSSHTDNDESKPNSTKEKLSGKYVTAALAALVTLLLVFFLGMRLIENRSERLTLQPGVSADTTEPLQKSIPQSGLININTATRDELMELDGIGEKKAQAIIDYRNEYGPFTAIEEITAVEGIGSGIFDRIKDEICV